MPFQDMSHAELIQACLDSDGDAWREFIRRYNAVISLAVLRTANRWGETSKPVLEDLIGDTYLKLCNKQFEILRKFKFRTEHSIFGFLKVIATNVVHDFFRVRKRETQLTVDLEDLYDCSSPDMPGSPHAMQRAVLIRQVETILEEIEGPEAERDKAIFWLRYRHDFRANEIAGILGIDLSPKGIE